MLNWTKFIRLFVGTHSCHHGRGDGDSKGAVQGPQGHGHHRSIGEHKELVNLYNMSFWWEYILELITCFCCPVFSKSACLILDQLTPKLKCHSVIGRAKLKGLALAQLISFYCCHIKCSILYLLVMLWWVTACTNGVDILSLLCFPSLLFNHFQGIQEADSC